MRDRIVRLLELLGISQAAFCRECDIKPATLSGMGDGLNTQTIIRIARRYPDLNLRWLLLGEGETWLAKERKEVKEEDSPVFSFVAQESPEIAFLRNMVSRQQDTIQILIRNIEKNYRAGEGATK